MTGGTLPRSGVRPLLLALLLLSALLLPGHALAQSAGQPPDGELPSDAANAAMTVEEVTSPAAVLDRGGALALPETVTVRYSGTTVDEPVVWEPDVLSTLDTAQLGTYEVPGTVTLSQPVVSGETSVQATCTVTVREPNLLAAWSPDHSVCLIDGTGVTLTADGLTWSADGAASVRFAPALSLERGLYTLEAAVQGAEGDEISLQILDAGGAVLASGSPAGSEEGRAEVTFALSEPSQVSWTVSLSRMGGTGSAGQFYLHRHEDLSYEPPEGGTHTVSCRDCASELLTEPCTFLPQSASDETEEAAAAFHFGCRCGRGRDWELSGTLTGLPDQIELLSGGTVTLVSSFQPAISPEQQSEAASLPGTEHISYTISYASSDEAVLQIDSSGVLTAGQAGEAELACSVYGTLATGTETFSCLVAQRFIPVSVTPAEEAASLYTVSTQAVWDAGLPAEDTPQVTLTGSGVYASGATASLRAEPAAGLEFLGWYDAGGILLTHAADYEFPVTGDMVCRAVYRPVAEPAQAPEEADAAPVAEPEDAAAVSEVPAAAGGTAGRTAQTSGADTGDNSAPLLYLLLLGLSAVAVGALVWQYLHRKK